MHKLAEWRGRSPTYAPVDRCLQVLEQRLCSVDPNRFHAHSIGETDPVDRRVAQVREGQRSGALRPGRKQRARRGSLNAASNGHDRARARARIIDA